MTSSPTSSTIRLPEHPECPVCFKGYDSTERIPMASGIPGCSHNACAPCVQELAKKIAGMNVNIKKCVQGCTLSQHDLPRLTLDSVKPVPNTDLIKAIDVVAEQSAIIAAVVEDAKRLSAQFLAAQYRILELERMNADLNSYVGMISQRVVTAAPVVRPFMSVEAPQPQPACSSKDLSSIHRQPRTPPGMEQPPTAEPTSVVFTKAQMNILFPPGHKENLEKMHRMKPAILDATLRAGNFDYTEHFDLLSDEQLYNVPLSQMSSEQIGLMFPEADSIRWAGRYCLRMSKIRPEEVKAALEAGKLSGYLACYLPRTFRNDLLS